MKQRFGDSTLPVIMKICIDSGHGHASRKWGQYDPGAVYAGVQEATIALQYALELQSMLHEKGIPTFLTRTNKTDPAPLGLRVGRCLSAKCTHLVSIHCNSAEDRQANGTEVLYRQPQDKALAEKLAQAVGFALGLRVRGAKLREDLAILRFMAGPAVLIELGFLPNDGDRAALLDEQKRKGACQAIVNALLSSV